MHFYRLSVETWKDGFKTQDEAFSWLKQSRLYNATRLVDSDAMRKKSDPALREMYYDFIKVAAADKLSKETPSIDTLREAALVEFGKKENYDAYVFKNRLNRARREKYNGKKVMEWTEKSGIIIRYIMDNVLEEIGEKNLIDFSEEELKEITLRVAKDIPPAKKSKCNV